MKKYIITGLVLSLLLNIYLSYQLLDMSISYSYSKISNNYLRSDTSKMVRLLNIVLKNTSRSKIEFLGSKMHSSECVVKKNDKGYIIGPLEFLFDNNRTSAILYSN